MSPKEHLSIVGIFRVFDSDQDTQLTFKEWRMGYLFLMLLKKLVTTIFLSEFLKRCRCADARLCKVDHIGFCCCCCNFFFFHEVDYHWNNNHWRFWKANGNFCHNKGKTFLADFHLYSKGEKYIYCWLQCYHKERNQANKLYKKKRSLS